MAATTFERTTNEKWIQFISERWHRKSANQRAAFVLLRTGRPATRLASFFVTVTHCDHLLLLLLLPPYVYSRKLLTDFRPILYTQRVPLDVDVEHTQQVLCAARDNLDYLLRTAAGWPQSAGDRKPAINKPPPLPSHRSESKRSLTVPPPSADDDAAARSDKEGQRVIVGFRSPASYSLASGRRCSGLTAP
jgi:hypothetical protein